MPRLSLFITLLATLTSQVGRAQDGRIPPGLDRPIDYAKDVAPIFEPHCSDCHGSDVQESNLRVDLKAWLLRGGDLGEPALIKEKGAESFLIQVDGRRFMISSSKAAPICIRAQSNYKICLCHLAR